MTAPDSVPGGSDEPSVHAVTAKAASQELARRGEYRPDAIGLLDQGPLPLSGDGEYVEGAM